MRLRYSATRTYTPIADNTLWTYAYRGNSVYDPDPAIGGSAPRAFNTMAAMYNTYRVRGSRCTIKPIMGGAGYGSTVSGISVNNMGIITLAASTDSTAYASFTEENIETQTAVMTKNLGHIYAIPQQSLSAYKSTKSMYRAIDPKDGVFSADVSTNPTQEWYWIIGYLTNGGTTAAGTAFLPIRVVIDYWVEFSDPKEIVS